MRKLWDLLRNKIGTKNLICGILGICIAVGWMWSFTAWRVALMDSKGLQMKSFVFMCWPTVTVKKTSG